MNELWDSLPEDRLAHLIKVSWQYFSRLLQIQLIEHSVSMGHWSILRVLWDEEGLTQKEISVRADIVAPTTHSAINAMEKLGYVTRRKSASNKKNIQVYLTPKGKKLEHKLVPLAIQVNEIATAGIDKDDIQTTRRCLLKIAVNLAESEKAFADQDRKMPSTRELSRRIAKHKPRN